MAKNFWDKDKGFNRLFTQFRVNAGETVAFAGYLRSSGEHKPKEKGKKATPITMASLAAVHEFGSPKRGIPERSFIRSSMAQHSRELQALTKKVNDAILMGKISKKQGLGILCQKVIDWIKGKIDEGVPPPNKPATIRRKGSDHPLVDTGQLRNSLDWEIKEKK